MSLNPSAYRRAGSALLGLLALLAVSVCAQSELPQYRVVDVQVVGNRVTTTSLILGVSAIDKGSILGSTEVQETIRRLYGLGIFSDVSIEAEQVSGGLKVYIVVKELPKLSGLDFSGNNVFKTKDLKDKLKLGVGGYISPYLVDSKREEIQQQYAEKGYFRAEVSPELTYNADSTEAAVRYKINERSKVKVDSVIVRGNARVPAKDIVGVMRNRKRGFLKSSTFAQDKYESDLEKVAEAFHKRGFIDAYVISDSTHIDTAANRMKVYLDVYEGPLYYFGKTTFKGNAEMKTEPLRSAMKYKEWQIFNSDKYDKSIMEIYTTYQEIGHLHVRVDDQKITRQDSILDISYDITEGLPSHVNLIKIVGNNRTREKVIRRELSVLPGQVFSRALLMRSIRDVMALNYFSNVEPIPIDLPNGDVDLEVKVTEKQTGQISAGAGYNSQDKLVGNIGLGIPNLGGSGQSLNLSVERGSNLNSVSISFTEPWLFGRPTLLGSELYTINRRWYDEYTEGRQGGSVRLGRRLRWPDNYFKVYASFRTERERYSDFDSAFVLTNRYLTKDIVYFKDPDSTHVDSLYRDTIPGSLPYFGGKWRGASGLSFTITRDSRNLPEFATKGSLVSYTYQFTGGVLGGWWHYQKHDLAVSKFLPVFWKFALATKVQFGAITSPDGDSHVMLSDRYTPGGTNYDGMVRGYDDGVLTPDTIYTQSDTLNYYTVTGSGSTVVKTLDSTVVSNRSARIRGKYLLVANAELQLPISKQQLYGLIFFDAGNSWLHFSDIKPFTGTYKSIGFGFRVIVPGIGTLGFDFGYPLNKFSTYSQTWKPHFQIGTTFK